MKGKWLISCALFLSLCCLPAQAEPLTASAPPDLNNFLSALHGPQPSLRSESIENTCTVTLECSGAPQGYISCTSPNGDCQAGVNWVECDDVRTYCPACYAECDCGDNWCTGQTSCSTTFGPHRVICDGVTYSCAPIRSCREW